MVDKQKNSNNSSDILWLASSLTSSNLWKVFIGIALLFLANQTFGDPIGKYMDNQFALETTEQNNTYELQKTTLEFIQNDVMDKLDVIYERLDNVEGDIDDLQNRVGTNEQWISNHR